MPQITVLIQILQTMEALGPAGQRALALEAGGTLNQSRFGFRLDLQGLSGLGVTPEDAIADWRAAARRAVARPCPDAAARTAPA